jgi:hypothetical protein
VKTLFGAAVFLLSLFAMRRILVNSGALDPWSAFLFVSATVGISFGGFLFLEAAFDAHRNQVRKEMDAMRQELVESSEASAPHSEARSSPPRSSSS